MKKKKQPKRAASERLHFTKRGLELLAPQDERRTVYDTHTGDLGLRVEPNGRKTFFRFRQVAGKPVFKTIGAFPSTTIDDARRDADEFSGNLAELKRHNYSPTVQNPFTGGRGELTLGELLEDYVSRRLYTNQEWGRCN